jgi:hypothetical protein
MTRSLRQRGARIAAALAVMALAACARTGVVAATDAFSNSLLISGPDASVSALPGPGLGPKVDYHLESIVAKAPPHGVQHRLHAVIWMKDFLTDAKAEQVRVRYQNAADDTATKLKVERIAAGSCGFGNAGCLHHETIAVALSDEALRAHVLTGYRIKIWPAEGADSILTVSPAMIQQQLSAVDAKLQGEMPALAPGAPHLGLGAIDATAAPYDGAPRGVIVVSVSPQSPGAAAGIKPGDVLRAIDQQAIRVTGDVIRRVSGLTPGQTVRLELERAGQPFSATLRL